MIRLTAAVVSSLSVGSALAGNKVTRRTSSYISGGSSENASGRNSSSDEGGERDHLEYELLVVGSEGRCLIVVVIYEATQDGFICLAPLHTAAWLFNGVAPGLLAEPRQTFSPSLRPSVS